MTRTDLKEILCNLAGEKDFEEENLTVIMVYPLTAVAYGCHKKIKSQIIFCLRIVKAISVAAK